jgi:hypothetical protein
MKIINAYLLAERKLPPHFCCVNTEYSILDPSACEDTSLQKAAAGGSQSPDAILSPHKFTSIRVLSIH